MSKYLQPSIPILMYHQVTPQPLDCLRKYTVTVRSFAAQMAWLALRKYTAITLDQLIEHRAGHGVLPPRPIVITFDDGFQDVFEYALPVLRQLHFTATFYLVVGLVGKRSHWLLAQHDVELPLMDWQSALQLERAGFQCAAHTMSHPHLAELPPHVCRQELSESRHLLEQQLGHPVRHLAYPYGSFNRQVRSIAAELGYRTACSVRIGRSPAYDDPLALHRIPVSGHDTLLDFVVRLRTGRTARESIHEQIKRGRRQISKARAEVHP
jgi:peptidoglycan/xylan/chitin deacetylase (PgdA/CDA1 family)